MTRRTLLVVALVVLATAPLHARPTMRTVRLRLEGYFGAPEDGRPAETQLAVRIGAQDRRLQVTKGRIPSGRGLAADVFAQVRVHAPNFVFKARKERLAEIVAIPDGAALTIDGQWIVGAPDFVVDSVEMPAG